MVGSGGRTTATMERRQRTRAHVSRLVLTALSAVAVLHVPSVQATEYPTKSGIRPWVDPATPEDKRKYTSSRGDEWELVMSDEFNSPGRSFEPGKDHMWTSIDKPDGVNAALGIYSHNMTSTECEGDTCYLQLQVKDEVTTLRLWNDYRSPAGYQKFSFFYRSGMVQSWNKFCYQGGMMEVRAQLPGATSASSGNPDAAANDPSVRVSNKMFYPTWPGIWMMGNLGRAIFSASTHRMWPFSYNECDNNAFDSSNQRISACDSDPGSDMNPNQGRGAPEIDILEAAGSKISASIQVAPGMPPDYRTFDATDDAAFECRYEGKCTTPGANIPDVPTKLYKSKRAYKSWYQGLRYAANNFCASSSKFKQDYDTIKASLDAGITENMCDISICPASFDPHSDLSVIDGTTGHWGINSNGTCFPVMNGYTGAYLCSPGNTFKLCPKAEIPVSDKVKSFAYQMDAISADWPSHVGAYTSYLIYQVEWVMGKDGYIRWMLAGQPLFEIPASALTNPEQNSAKTNPKKIMIEEPMYMIINVAVSKNWGTTPPNPGKPCRGDGSDDTTNKICDSFPMSLKVDYVRLYQDTSSGSNMAVGCDPKTHPTKTWIKDHLEEYQDDDNPVVEVNGRAFCKDDADCTISPNNGTKVVTGQCVKSRCKCMATSWSGPRCTSTSGSINDPDPNKVSDIKNLFTNGSFGPPFSVALATAGFTIVLSMVSVYYSLLVIKKNEQERKKQVLMQPKSALSISSASEVSWRGPKDNYSTNFV
ncbi:TPA: hypothetical protein N0F65_004365 [Lagenidium giganteum]|uniref:Beta-glucan synthesis-associated protein n=1 Tax=Lagenidium giganteum TaxID=4803 RepID=A0AAV2ZJC9_9STRA|nr:TPA: hypothetical protein N0F65_004365 [Lagenidium giganteum]